MNNGQTIKILRRVYENAETGMNVIEKVISKAKSNELKSFLELQKETYYDIAEEASILLADYRELPPQVGFFSRLAAEVSFMMNAVGGAEDEKTAELLINGCVEGVIDITRALGNSEEADYCAKCIAERLVLQEQNCMRGAERFL